jgi:hypothetical protein
MDSDDKKMLHQIMQDEEDAANKERQKMNGFVMLKSEFYLTTQYLNLQSFAVL